MVNAHAVTFGGLVMFSGASLLGGFATGQFAAARVLTELPADRANRRDRTVTGIVGMTRLVYGGSSPTDRSDAYLIMLFIGTAMFGMFFSSPSSCRRCWATARSGQASPTCRSPPKT